MMFIGGGTIPIGDGYRRDEKMFGIGWRRFTDLLIVDDKHIFCTYLVSGCQFSSF